MAKYLPAWLSDIIKETGAHPMCVLRKMAERGIPADPSKAAEIRKLAEECVREGKLVPVLKYIKKLGLK